MRAGWPPSWPPGLPGRSLLGRLLLGRLLFGQAQGALADDVPLDLAGPGVDRAGPAAEEHALPGGHRVSAAVRPEQPVRALDADRDLAQPLVVLAPEEFGHRSLRARRAARPHLRHPPQPAGPPQLR